MPRRIIGIGEIDEVLDDKLRRPLDELLVEAARQQVLAILVGLPRGIQNARERCDHLGREEGPEPASSDLRCALNGPHKRQVPTFRKDASVFTDGFGWPIRGAGGPPELVSLVRRQAQPRPASLDPQFAAARSWACLEHEFAHLGREEQEFRREYGDVVEKPVSMPGLADKSNDGCRPFHQLAETGVDRSFFQRVHRLRRAQNRDFPRLGPDAPDPFGGSPGIEPE